MTDIINNKPCVVETPQGFSVSYKNRFLYSRYNPSKIILQKISQLEILPGTVILCNSPVLCYGLKELKEKLPESCLIFLCEFDKSLHTFTENTQIYKSLEDDYRIIFPNIDELYDLPISIFNISSSGNYKRILALDLSSGTQFYTDLYKRLEAACINSIRTFWTNRLTLTKFGRQYSYNFFNNLQKLKYSTPIQSYFNKVSKPVLVFGAGESVDYFFNKYSISQKDYYILCVDTIMSSLISRNIIPNGVFVEEAQSIISKAFICNKYNIQLFTGLSSLPMLSQYFKDENISYFTTEYTKAKFIDNLAEKNLLPFINSPFGSVGLTTVYYALKFRKDSNVPVYITGLDFSYSAGYTHGKGTLAHITRLLNTNKLTPIENYQAAFSDSAIKILDKNNNNYITTPALKNYSNLFNNMFSNEKNLFDVSDCGIKLSVERLSLPAIKGYSEKDKETPDIIKKETFSKKFQILLDDYLTNEVKELKRLRYLLSEKTDIPQEELQKEITKIATSKEYLYLHFPDGYKFNYNQSFLNRIRTEIDFFLKLFD